MTSQQLAELEKVIMTAAVVNAVAAWPDRRLEEHKIADEKAPEIIARMSKRILETVAEIGL